MYIRLMFIVGVVLLCVGCTGRILINPFSQLSMEPSIGFSDWVVYEFKDTGSVYNYGDVVYFQSEEFPAYFAFRVVGLPGDSIGMENHICVINGKKNRSEVISENALFDKRSGSMPAIELEEEFPNGKKVRLYIEKEYDQTRIISSFEAQQVPPNHYFLLGDSRSLAYDSRYIGFISTERIAAQIVKIWGK